MEIEFSWWLVLICLIFMPVFIYLLVYVFNIFLIILLVIFAFICFLFVCIYECYVGACNFFKNERN